MSDANTRVAIIAMIAKDNNAANQVNAILHDYNAAIVGRMGLPYRDKGVYIINIVVDAPLDTINTLAGKLGRVESVTVKTVYS